MKFMNRYVFVILQIYRYSRGMFFSNESGFEFFFCEVCEPVSGEEDMKYST